MSTTVVRASIATLLAMLPRRYWSRFEPALPVWRMVGPFRILAVEDRTIAGRLRSLYSLTPHEDLEVFRRAVRYRFPGRERQVSEVDSV